MTRVLTHGLLALAFAAVSACGGSGSSATAPTAPTPPTPPTPPAITLAGTYSGPASDSSGGGSMTWRITQTGTNVAGVMTAHTTEGTVTFTGTLNGSLDGASLTFTVSVPVGAVLGFPACTVAISGTAAPVTSASIPGTYSGTSSCAAPFSGGRFTLTKE